MDQILYFKRQLPLQSRCLSTLCRCGQVLIYVEGFSTGFLIMFSMKGLSTEDLLLNECNIGFMVSYVSLF